MAEFFTLFREPAAWLPRYNIGPLQRIVTIREKSDGHRHADLMQWGLVPSWATDQSVGSRMINVRSETVFTEPVFRSAFRQRRCLIPATGFYEWQQLTDSKRRPWHIFPQDGQPFAFAGLWETWRASDRTTLCSCAFITVESNRWMKAIHDRMPVILPIEKWNLWLNHAQDSLTELAKLFVACPSNLLEKKVVGSFVNTLRNDSPECISPIPAENPSS